MKGLVTDKLKVKGLVTDKLKVMGSDWERDWANNLDKDNPIHNDTAQMKVKDWVKGLGWAMG